MMGRNYKIPQDFKFDNLVRDVGLNAVCCICTNLYLNSCFFHLFFFTLVQHGGI